MTKFKVGDKVWINLQALFDDLPGVEDMPYIIKNQDRVFTIRYIYPNIDPTKDAFVELDSHMKSLFRETALVKVPD